VRILTEILQWLGIIFAGILISFAHPFRFESYSHGNSFWTFIVASFGLLLLFPLILKEGRPVVRFLKGFTAGSIFYAICMYWVIHAISVFGGLPPLVATLIAASLWCYCGAYWGLWALISGSRMVLQEDGIWKLVSWASLWAALESVRQIMISGFPWGELGFHFSYMPLVRESVSVWGVHGLTFFWIFFIASILYVDQVWPNRRERKIFIGIVISFVLVCVGARLSVSFYQTDQQLKVALIQPNVEQELKWDPGQIGPITERLLDMTSRAIEQKADLIVWPETAYPRLVGATQKQLPFSTNTPLLIGAVVRDGQTNRNSALLVQGDQIIQRFDKAHLVPFGEYVPLQEILPFKKLVANVGDFKPGAWDQPLIEIQEKNLKIGPLICYEDIFNRSSVNLAKRGAQILVNMTNDAWYGTTSAQFQHATMAEFQSLQTFLPLVRATNNGVSTVISPLKREDQPSFQQSLSVHEVGVSSKPRKTFFVWTHPLMEWIWVLLFAMAVLWKRNPRKRRIFFRN